MAKSIDEGGRWRRLAVLAATIAVCMCGAASGQTRYYVDGDIDPPGEEGQSWSDAFATIHEALGEAVAGDEIWVKAGTYTPALPSNRAVSFALERGIRILGGFEGNENFVEERDIEANPTILDGDLNGDDEPDFAKHDDNSFHVVRVTVTSDWDPKEDEQAVLDGLIIRGGNADGSDFDAIGGGVLLLDESSTASDRIWLLLQSTRLTDNSADGAGGGLAAYETAVEFRDCLLDGNRALGVENSLRLYGGAGFYAGAVRTTRTVLDSNRAFDSSGGGAVISSIALANADSYLVNTEFLANRAGDAGGGLLVESGNVEIANCLAAGNHVELDAGSDSNAVPAGGGFAFRSGNAFLVNSTVADNTAVNDLDAGGGNPGPGGSGGGAIVGIGAGAWRGPNGLLDIRNSVFWGNRVTIGAPSDPQDVDHHRAQVNVLASGSVSASPIAFTNIENNIGCVSPCTDPSPDGWFNIGHVSLIHDPLFNDPSFNDYRHRSGAMASAGDSLLVPDDENDLDDNGITNEALPLDLAAR